MSSGGKALHAGTIDAALQMIPYDFMAVEAGFTDLGPVTEEFALNAVCARLPAERAELTPFLRASRRGGAMVPRSRRGVGRHRGGTHLDRAALRAASLPGAGLRRVIPRELRSSPAALAAVTAALRSSGLIPPEATAPVAAVDYSYL